MKTLVEGSLEDAGVDLVQKGSKSSKDGEEAATSADAESTQESDEGQSSQTDVGTITQDKEQDTQQESTIETGQEKTIEKKEVQEAKEEPSKKDKGLGKLMGEVNEEIDDEQKRA